MARTSRVFSLGRRPTVKEGVEKEDAKQDAGTVNGTAPESGDRPTTPVEQRTNTQETAPSPSEDSEIAETSVRPPPRDNDDVGTVSRSATEPTVTSQDSSPKSQSKLKSWFKSKVSRRFSKQPVAEETGGGAAESQDRDDNNTSSRGQEHEEEEDGPRAAPLSSNPVTERDIAPSVRSGDNQDPAMRQWSTSTTGSAHDNNKTTENSSRRSRLRMSLKGMITRKSESPLSSPTTPTAAPASSRNVGAAALAASARPAAARLNTMECVELRDSFTEGSLPPPPNLFSSPKRGSMSSSARDSKFSEDLD